MLAKTALWMALATVIPNINARPVRLQDITPLTENFPEFKPDAAEAADQMPLPSVKVLTLQDKPRRWPYAHDYPLAELPHKDVVGPALVVPQARPVMEEPLQAQTLGMSFLRLYRMYGA